MELPIIDDCTTKKRLASITTKHIVMVTSWLEINNIIKTQHVSLQMNLTLSPHTTQEYMLLLRTLRNFFIVVGRVIVMGVVSVSQEVIV